METQSTARPPFDQSLSTRLDLIQIQLDEHPSTPRRWWLRARKRMAERKIPPTMAPCCRCGDALGLLPLDPDGSAFCETCFEVQR